MPAKMEKKPDRTQNPNDQDRKLESGLGSHCRSTSALTPNMITDIVMKAAAKQQQNIRLSYFLRHGSHYNNSYQKRESKNTQLSPTIM